MKRILLKTNQNHPQIKAYKQAVEKGKKNQHVLPKAGSWIVKRADSLKATRVFDTQRQAISHATIIAQNQGTALFVHGEDGRIRERVDFQCS